MEPILMIIIGLSLVLMLISTLVVAVAAFRQHVVWGLVYLFVPLGNLAFVVRHWAVAKTGFLVSIASGVVALGAIMMLPGTFQNFLAKPDFAFSTSHTDRAAELTAQIQEKRNRSYQLETAFAEGTPILKKQFEDLEKRRKALNVSDTEAVTQFNAEAAVYQQHNAQRKVILSGTRDCERGVEQSPRRARNDQRCFTRSEFRRIRSANRDVHHRTLSRLQGSKTVHGQARDTLRREGRRDHSGCLRRLQAARRQWSSADPDR